MCPIESELVITIGFPALMRFEKISGFQSTKGAVHILGYFPTT